METLITHTENSLDLGYHRNSFIHTDELRGNIRATLHETVKYNIAIEKHSNGSNQHRHNNTEGTLATKDS